MLGKGGDVEELPPQTGVNDENNLVLFNVLNSLILILVLVIRKFV